MRLIDADALCENMRKWLAKLKPEIFVADRVKNDVLNTVIVILENEPTIEAVEVVHCKDCVHAGAFPNAYSARRFEEGMNCYLCRGDDGYGIANVSVVYPDDYCNDGVRKEKKGAELHDQPQGST